MKKQLERLRVSLRKRFSAKKQLVDMSLEAQRVRNHNILEGTNAGTWDWNIATGELIINERWADIIGYTLDELKPITVKVWENSVHPADMKAANEMLEQHFAKEIDYYDVQFRQRHKSGDWRWVHARGKVILRTGDGAPIHMSGTHMDITERKEIEVSLLESQQMLSNVINNIPIRVFWKDRESRFLGSNLLAAQDLHLDNPNDLIGKNDYDFSTKEAAEHFRSDDQQIMESKKPRLNYEESLILKDGSLRWLLTSKMPLMDHAGAVIGILGTYEDITKSKRVKEELIQAKEDAEAANNAKDDFLAVMSHEMRTPLNPIIGYADILLKSCNKEPETTYIETILNAANRQLHLIDDILDYMRINRGKVSTNAEPFNLIDLCELVIFDAKVSASDLELNFENGRHGRAVATELTIDSDLMMLRRALDNLVNNACKYTEEGSITLSVSQDVDNPTIYLIKVEDTGIGIEATNQKSLFEPFNQADNSYTRQHGGVGLGLAICKKLTEALGGDISVESTLGRGSCFTLRMPFKIVDEPSALPLLKTKDQSTPLFEKLYHILVIADKAEDAQITQTMVQSLGGRSTLAENISIAVQLCQAQSFDLVILDISLSGSSNIDAARALRQVANLNITMPIIEIIADSSLEASLDHSETEIDEFITKPISSLRLYDLIESALASHTSRE